MAEKLLTLMADLDDESQRIMESWYHQLKEAGFEGVQTPNLPYHISLATFSVDQEKEAIDEVKRIADRFIQFSINISHIGIFSGGKVLFGAPNINSTGLLEMHEAIQLETIDQFLWTPHVTILMDEPETIQKALPVLLKSFFPFSGTITRLHLCAFWPTREIATIELKK